MPGCAAKKVRKSFGTTEAMSIAESRLPARTAAWQTSQSATRCVRSLSARAA
jgi:hypothetical protein